MSPVGWETLYLSHALLELVLGLLKLRGRYAHEKPRSKPQRSEMYTRHHGGALLALALQGVSAMGVSSKWSHGLVFSFLISPSRKALANLLTEQPSGVLSAAANAFRGVAGHC
eukprot:6183680-Pleurochrysis_carterae.AAC.2